eukprot:TRINITY_DN37213_c0_g1_i1.p1 TRINITY_DN37213_c0_g1~~TRINITY_DN37213_c0_g1_i1.p1  ORF type:complete len:208 (+),score=37.91 TRINITY_DN37213_c0_g1_i1:91-714(+)
MKFGQRLIEQRAVLEGDALRSVLDYKKLKKAISNLKKECTTREITEGETGEWMEIFTEEVAQFEEYMRGAVEDCSETVEQCEKLFEAKKPQKRTSLKDIYLEIQELRFLVDLNQTATRKILKKFDKNVPGHGVSSWRTEIGAELFERNMEPLRVLTQKLTAIYAALHHSNRCKIAEMELDYHVSCVSDLFSFMMDHVGMVRPVNPVC